MAIWMALIKLVVESWLLVTARLPIIYFDDIRAIMLLVPRKRRSVTPNWAHSSLARKANDDVVDEEFYIECRQMLFGLLSTTVLLRRSQQGGWRAELSTATTFLIPVHMQLSSIQLLHC